MITQPSEFVECPDAHAAESRAPALRDEDVINVEGRMPMVTEVKRRPGFLSYRLPGESVVGATQAKLLKLAADAAERVSGMRPVEHGVRVEIPGDHRRSAFDKRRIAVECQRRNESRAESPV